MAEEKHMDILDRDIQTAAGGLGVVGQVVVLGAFNVYAKGAKPRERTFTYYDSATKAVASRKANEFAASHSTDGKPPRVEQTIAMVVKKEEVLGRDVSKWQDDWFITAGPHFGPDAKEVNRRRVELGMQLNKPYYAQIICITSPNAEANQDKAWAWDETQENDENGQPKRDENGDLVKTKRLKLLQVPARVFASKEEAVEAAATAEDFVDVSDVPQKWLSGGGDVSTWRDMMVPEIQDVYERRIKGGMTVAVALVNLANQYGVTPVDIGKVVGVSEDEVNSIVSSKPLEQ